MSTCVQYVSLLALHVLLPTRQTFIFRPLWPGYNFCMRHRAAQIWSGNKFQKKKKKKNTALPQPAVCHPCIKACKVPPASGFEVFLYDFCKGFMKKGGVSISGQHRCALRPRLWNGLKMRLFFSLSFLSFFTAAAVLRAFNGLLQLIVCGWWVSVLIPAPFF